MAIPGHTEGDLGGFDKLNHKIFSAILATAVVAPSALAQAPDVTPTNLAFRLGAVVPIDYTFRKVQNQFIGVGVDWTLQEQLQPNMYTFFAFDWIGRSFAGAHGNVFPITINERFYLSSKREQAFYGVAGAGAFIEDVGTHATDTAFGLRGGIGYNFGPNIFGEVIGLIATPISGGLKVSGASFYLGYRF